MPGNLQIESHVGSWIFAREVGELRMYVLVPGTKNTWYLLSRTNPCYYYYRYRQAPSRIRVSKDRLAVESVPYEPVYNYYTLPLEGPPTPKARCLRVTTGIHDSGIATCTVCCMLYPVAW